jgi:hypothetical protein
MELVENVLQDVLHVQSHQHVTHVQIQTETLTTTVHAMSVFTMQGLTSVLLAIRTVLHVRTGKLALLVIPEDSELYNQVFAYASRDTLS